MGWNVLMKISKKYLIKLIVESINDNELKNIFKNMGKLNYNSQNPWRGNKSFAEKNMLKNVPKGELPLSFLIGKELGRKVYFDNTNLVDEKTGKTILPDALSGKFTFDEIIANVKK
jgi:hypothetical protein